MYTPWVLDPFRKCTLILHPILTGVSMKRHNRLRALSKCINVVYKELGMCCDKFYTLDIHVSYIVKDEIMVKYCTLAATQLLQVLTCCGGRNLALSKCYYYTCLTPKV